MSFYDSPYPIFHETVGSSRVSSDEVTLELHLSHADAIALLKYMTR